MVVPFGEVTCCLSSTGELEEVASNVAEPQKVSFTIMLASLSLNPRDLAAAISFSAK